MAKSSAFRSGFSNGSRLIAVPSRIREVSRATAVRKNLRTRTNPKGVEMLLSEPDRVKAQLFGHNAQFQRILKIPDFVLSVSEKVE